MRQKAAWAETGVRAPIADDTGIKRGSRTECTTGPDTTESSFKPSTQDRRKQNLYGQAIGAKVVGMNVEGLGKTHGPEIRTAKGATGFGCCHQRVALYMRYSEEVASVHDFCVFKVWSSSAVEARFLCAAAAC